MMTTAGDGPARSELATRPTWQLLAANGDERHRLDETGHNRYRNRYGPEPDLVGFGSCTSSTVSDEAYGQAQRLHGWLRSLDERYLNRAIDDLFQGIRSELKSNLAVSAADAFEVVITPSGTDAEYVPLLIALERGSKVTSVVVGAGEAGSGTTAAAGGLHFDAAAPSGAIVTKGDPVDPAIAGRVEVRHIDIRDAHSRLRPLGEIDAEVADVVAESRAAGRSVLVHLIAHSKTGIHAPSPALLNTLADLDDVDVVIDAAQGRFSRRGLGAALREGRMAIVTGSKFFGGPPFCGAVLVPRRPGRPEAVERLPEGFRDYFSAAMLPRSWVSARASLGHWHNVGLLLRWWASLQEIRDYYSVPAQLRFEVLTHFQQVVPEITRGLGSIELDVVPTTLAAESADRLLESKTTVFPFRCRDALGRELGADELVAVRHRIRHPDHGRSFEIGQPVTLGSGGSQSSLLRVALGGRNVIRACVVGEAGDTFADRLNRLSGDVRDAFTAIDAAAREHRG